MKKINYYLSILTTLSLLSCTQTNPLLKPNQNNFNSEEGINTDTNLKVKSVIPEGFAIKAKQLKSGDIIEGRFIVKFKEDGKTDDENIKTLNKFKAKNLGEIKKSKKIHLIEAENILNNNVLDTMKANPDVEYIEPDRIRNIDSFKISGLTNVLAAKVVSFTMTEVITFPGGSFKNVTNITAYSGSSFKLANSSTGTIYSYIIRDTCLEGPKPPATLTFSIPLCNAAATPVPSALPTATAVPVPIPTVKATALPTVAPVPIPTKTPSPTIFKANDPELVNQYSISKIKALEAWGITTGTADVTIAIIDTGIDTTHPDLAGKIVPGYSTFTGQNPKGDPNGHGTHCAGIAAAAVNNGIGIVGVAPNARLMPIQVLDASGAGSDSLVAAGIMYAADSPAKVLSMSLGGPGYSQTVQNAVNYAVAHNKVLVAAMGNYGNNVVSYPAGLNGVIAVGATDQNDQRAYFSQFGPHISVTAPGVQINSTWPANTYRYESGTSMATPAVAGLAALLLGYRPNLTPAQVKTKIEQGADDLGVPGFDIYYGYGRINVLKTITAG